MVTNEEVGSLARCLHVPGAKDDAGKTRAGLMLRGFNGALKEVSRVTTFGAEKYTPNGWKTVPNARERYEDALIRHYLEYAAGTEKDPESGISHLAHFAWNALAILQLALDDTMSADSDKAGS